MFKNEFYDEPFGELDEEEMKKDLVSDDSSYCLPDDEEICHHKIMSEHLSSLHL